MNRAPASLPGQRRRASWSLSGCIQICLLLAAVLFFVLHFLHLNADFPNGSPWVDWSKYTDEGWYGDAAIRHYTSGHWYWAGDFNRRQSRCPCGRRSSWIWSSASAGVTPVAARATTLCSLCAHAWERPSTCCCAEVRTRPASGRRSVGGARTVAVFFLALSALSCLRLRAHGDSGAAA